MKYLLLIFIFIQGCATSNADVEEDTYEICKQERYQYAVSLVDMYGRCMELQRACFGEDAEEEPAQKDTLY